MLIASWRKLVLIAGTLGLPLFIGLHFHEEGSALARVNAQSDDKKPEGKHGRFIGAAICSGCHTEQKKPFNTELVLLTEYVKWSGEDKHSQAYDVLYPGKNVRSKHMATILGWEVLKDPRCLNCHAIVAKGRQSPSFRFQDGVSCDGCHGPSSGWNEEHYTDGDWRKRDPDYKVKLGLVDLRDPVQRAEKCVSCHVGNVAENKVVTHAMYAAGHPPLPSFELATFSDGLPRHWRLLRDVPYLQKTPQAINDLYHYHPGEIEQARLVVVGALVSLRESMDLLASQAGSSDKAERAPTTWPELAQFDCYACHHDLKSSTWRQRLALPGKPGRPRFRAWPLTLVQLCLPELTDRKSDINDFETQVTRLSDGFGAQPFGKQSDIAAAARSLRAWANDRLKEVPAKPFTRARAQSLLSDLCTVQTKSVVEYDAARQCGWAFQKIYQELRPLTGSKLPPDAILEALDSQLHLTLPRGKVSITSRLPDILQRINDYDPEAFVDKFKTLSRTLPQRQGKQ